jgi:predicted nicotinamide N-methyase
VCAPNRRSRGAYTNPQGWLIGLIQANDEHPMSDLAAFIRSVTIEQTPPLVPEIRLHLASEIVPLWQQMETDSGRTNTPPPYWAFAWAGGQALARYVLDSGLAGAEVLDFGSGSGLVAIAAAKAGAKSVLAADIDPYSAAAIALNAEANNANVIVTTENVIGQNGAWSVILVGDMCYERPLAEALTAWLKARAGAGATVLMGDPGRSYFPASGVEKLVSYTVPTSRELEDREIRETGVFRLMA